MRKYKNGQLNRYTDNTYRFFDRMLDKPITSKILRLAAEINEATGNEIAMALILSNKCMMFGEELQHFESKDHDSMKDYESHLPHFLGDEYNGRI